MADGDVMVVALIIEKIAQGTGQMISITGTPNGYTDAYIGKCSFYGLTTEYGRSEYYCTHNSQTGRAVRVKPQRIRFGKEPQNEDVLTAGKQGQDAK